MSALPPLSLTRCLTNWLTHRTVSNKLSELANLSLFCFFPSLNPPPRPALTTPPLCFHLHPLLHTLPLSVHLQGGPVFPGLPEVQAGGRLGPLLAGIHGPQPGRRSPLHLFRRGWPGEPRRRRGPGQQWRGLRWLRWLPASGLLRCRRETYPGGLTASGGRCLFPNQNWCF